MRDAKAADWRRRLSERRADWPIKLQRLAITGAPSIGAIEVAGQSPLTVFAGPNGVGKTTLLRAVWACLEPEAARATIVAGRKLTAGSISAEFINIDATETFEVAFSTEDVVRLSGGAIDVRHVDGASFATTYQRAFCGFDSSEELLNGAGARELDDVALAEICYILKRTYRSITLYEVELDGLVPFFEVAHGDDLYDSRTMGAGELSALYIWWALSSAPDKSVVLIEEPEAYLSLGCQRNLANLLVKQVVDKQLVSLVTSHSSAFIVPMPPESVVFLFRGQNGLAVIPDRPPPALLQQMGIDPPVKVIAYVEDSLARLVCRSILEKYDASLSRQIFIEQRNGHGDIKSALKINNSERSPIKFVGIFDGDLRDELEQEFRPRSTFLPGTAPMEAQFRDMAMAAPDCLDQLTENPNVPALIAALEGIDHHDWYDELAKGLGITREQLFSMLFNVWISRNENEAAALESYEALVTLLG